jgi:uncharacterized protein (DUF488 family)
MNARASKTRPRIKLFTIGFAGKSAEQFFNLLHEAGVKRLVDTRLNNVSQLAGFTKKRDLEYCLREITGIEYVHDIELAPTADILDPYKKGDLTWDEYELRFNELIERRSPSKTRRPEEFDRACLLCSEPEPDHCHRRLVAEYLQRAWGNVEIRHL